MGMRLQVIVTCYMHGVGKHINMLGGHRVGVDAIQACWQVICVGLKAIVTWYRHMHDVGSHVNMLGCHMDRVVSHSNILGCHAAGIVGHINVYG